MSTCELWFEPWASCFMRKIAASRSVCERKRDFAGVCGRKKIVRIPIRMVMMPSTTKIHGQRLYPLNSISANPVASSPPMAPLRGAAQ